MSKKRKRLRKNEQGLREMQENMKRNNIRIIGIPEGEEEEQGIENLFEKVMMENFPNLIIEKVIQIQESQKVPTTTESQRHTQSQQKPQPKISKLGRSRRLNLTGILHRSLHHKSRGSEHSNLRSRG